VASLEDTQQILDQMLTEAESLFVPGAVLTFVMRVPDRPESYLILTREKDFTEVIELLKKESEKRG
jgi:hypothetical protein